MTTLTVEIPDQLMFQLNDTGDPVQEIVIKALEFYLDSEASNRRKKYQLEEFERLCLKAGLQAEEDSLTEDLIEQELEEIKTEVYREIYGKTVS